MSTPKDKKVPVMVRLSAEVVSKLDEAAEKDGRSRADVVRILLERAFGSRTTASSHATAVVTHAPTCSCLMCKPEKGK